MEDLFYRSNPLLFDVRIPSRNTSQKEMPYPVAIRFALCNILLQRYYIRLL